MAKWLKRGALGVLGGVLLALAGVALYGWRALPVTDGTLALPGAGAELRIERDAHGIPTIRAASLADAMFGLGVVHAQDRLWQMETHRRIGAGRLAEAFGPPALDTDRFLRALGVRRAAAAQWAGVNGPTREVLLAYARGVNAVLRQTRARPPEMLLLGIQPEDWDPVDSLAWSIMMAWDLGANWNTELLRMRLSQKLPVSRIDELLPPYPGEAPLKVADYAALYRSLGVGPSRSAAAELEPLRRLAAAPPSGVEGAGSNNWVLAGAHSSTGAPLLANDPHLKLSAPALWYFARIEAPGYKVAGATLPGMPLVVLGQNEQIAWGFTNTGPDVQDLYLERLKSDDAQQYQTPEGWARFERFDEVIKVRGAPDVALTVRRTRHGPVISDAGIADDLIGPKDRPQLAIAMRWPALDADVDGIGVALRYNRAGSVAEFVDALRGWVAPMQNMVVADKAGHIGVISPGRVPRRQADNDLRGQVPAPGWETRYDWDGWLPFDALWQERDPARGWIATANQRVVPADWPHFLTSEWALPYRQQRIEQMLGAKPVHSLADLRAMQADQKSLAVPVLLPWLLKAKSGHALAAAAQSQLQGFDGTMAADRAAPLIYWAFARQLTQAVFADEVGAAFAPSLSSRSYFDALTGVLARDDAWWCDDKATPAAETCAMQADRAFAAALDELQALQGSDPAGWRWGQAHQMRAEHRPFSRVKALAGLFELRTPMGGDTYTVNVSRVTLKPDATTGELYLDEHGPSLRALYDLADPKQSRFMHSSGQSGLPWSPLYRSFVQPWATVQDVPVWADGPPARVLVVTPGG